MCIIIGSFFGDVEHADQIHRPTDEKKKTSESVQIFEYGMKVA